MIKNTFAAMLLGAAVLAGADEIMTIKTMQDWASGSAVRAVEDGVWRITGSCKLAGAKSFKVDPAKKYILSMEMRKLPATQKVLVYAGFWPLNEDMVRIEPHCARCEPGTATKLAAPVKEGDTAIRITLPKRWKKGARDWCVSFRDQARCAEPDMDVICCRSASEPAADGSVEIKLANPVPQDCPEGTPIHFHSEGPGMYSLCDMVQPSDEWVKYSCAVTGVQKRGTPGKEQWWNGTEYGKFRFLTVGAAKDAQVEIRNIRLVEAVRTDPVVRAPSIAVPAGSFPDWTDWPSFAEDTVPAVKGYAAWDKHNLYLVFDIAQKGPVFAGEGRGIAYYGDGVELTVNRGKEDSYLQVHGDAGGALWVQEKYKTVPAGEIRLVTRREKDKGYQLCFVLPWKRLAPRRNTPSATSIRVFHRRVTKPLTFETRSFPVLVRLEGRASAPAPATPAAIEVPPKERVMNFGRPGFNSAELLEMLPVVLDAKPKLVVLMIGTNDVVWTRKLRTPDQTAADLRKIVDTITASGAKMILCTIPPCIEAMVGKREKMDAAATAGLNAKVQAINGHIRALAAEKKIPLADFHSLFTGDLTGQDSLIRNAVNARGQDGVHPTAAGYVKMAQMVYDLIRKNALPTDNIVCAGDSITYGSQMAGQGSSRGETYPARLRELLEGGPDAKK